MKKYITGQELLRSTTINSHDLADLILNEKIQAFYPENHTSVFDDLLDHWKEIVTDHKKRGIYLISKSVNKLDQTVASELKAFQEQVIPWLIEQIPELLFLIDEVELIQKEFPRPSSNELIETKIEPGTKLHAHEVKKHWEIDKLKLAEYVWEKGLPAFDQYGRKIPTVEMVVALNAIDLKNEPEKQKEFIADQIAYFISDDVLNFEYDHGIIPAPAKESTPAPRIEPLSNEEAEEFIRSLQISYLDDTEIKIQYQGKSKNWNCDSLGFRDSKTKEWKKFLTLLQDRDHIINLGPAYYIDEKTQKRERNKIYDQNYKLLKELNKKLIIFLNKSYQVKFPDDFNLYQRHPEEGHGIYSFKFKVPSTKSSYKTKDQALKRLKVLILNGASEDAIHDAVATAMNAGASRDEVSNIIKDMNIFTIQNEYGADDLERDDDLEKNYDDHYLD